jgi:hypothetical protein
MHSGLRIDQFQAIERFNKVVDCLVRAFRSNGRPGVKSKTVNVGRSSKPEKMLDAELDGHNFFGLATTLAIAGWGGIDLLDLAPRVCSPLRIECYS